jgi:hypothetical protein
MDGMNRKNTQHPDGLHARPRPRSRHLFCSQGCAPWPGGSEYRIHCSSFDLVKVNEFFAVRLAVAASAAFTSDDVLLCLLANFGKNIFAKV